VLIGPNWADSRDQYGKRRLNDPADWVRIEIEMALAGAVEVVPVLVNGAAMPRTQDLPASLRPLLRRHAATVRRDPDFHDDVGRLAKALDESLRERVAPFYSVMAASDPSRPAPPMRLEPQPAPRLNVEPDFANVPRSPKSPKIAAVAAAGAA